jgi:hypothetical protein
MRKKERTSNHSRDDSADEMYKRTTTTKKGREEKE